MTGSSASSSTTGGSSASGSGTTSVSLCAPHPWSRLTTRPSSDDQLFAHTPNTRDKLPDRGTKNPHEVQDAAADRALGAVGPASPSYQRVAASDRPCAPSTRARPRPISHASAASASPSSRTPVASYPCTRRGSSSTRGSTSVGPTSPGRRRSAHGSQDGASTASSAGSSTTSETVATLARGARATTTDHAHPRYPGAVQAKRWTTTRSVPSGSAPLPRCSPTPAAPATSTAATRARSTAAAATASFAARRARGRVVKDMAPQPSRSSATLRSTAATLPVEALSG